jgi:glycine/D-amino acid oxidase-like deaminating enzyme
VLPGLHQHELVAHGTGYRPLSADELPVVGLLPGFENVYIGTGGGSKGILVSSGIGMALLDLVEGQNVDSHHFLTPERFDAVQ